MGKQPAFPTAFHGGIFTAARRSRRGRAIGVSRQLGGLERSWREVGLAKGQVATDGWSSRYGGLRG
ncbi:hypothetical protein TorRG33x02_258120 [Trema orientale]|uniref:Uncharacterized protein n=1 Tax=Trema orientale TaxID=63057 RepID=A0A2P5D9U8_TREOI|nr:hypothetical protein TorRG33x02_258120 [Trema orientale]